MPEELDEIRLKEPDELTEDEVKVLKENVDDLTDEEKEDYKDVLVEKKEGEEEEEEEEGKEKPVTFKTQEAFDTAVDKRVKEMQVEAEEKKKEEEEGKKEKRLFPKGYKPEDWNQFARDFLPVVRKTTRKDTETYTKEQRERRAEINKQLDQETEDLRKIDPSIPSIKSKKRTEFDRSIAEIMIKDPKITTVTKAYGVYKEAQTSGTKKKQKDLAGKVGGGAGTGETTKKVKYEKFASRDMDVAEEAALRKFKALK